MAVEIEFATVPIKVTVNGVKHEAVVEPRTLLVYFLREHLNLTGTHVGCDTSQCGACTIQLNGRAVKSCTILAVQANGTEITPSKVSRGKACSIRCRKGFAKNTACSVVTAPRA